LAIVACVAAVVAAPGDDLRDSAQRTITEQSLLEVRGAIVGARGQAGFRDDLNAWPQFLADLYQQPLLLGGQPALPAELQQFDPVSRYGWRGPYLQHGGGRYAADPARGFLADYGADGWPTAVDAWGRPIVLQWPQPGGMIDPRPYLRLVSAGPNGVLETPREFIYPSRASCGDDIVLYLQSADLRP